MYRPDHGYDHAYEDDATYASFDPPLPPPRRSRRPAFVAGAALAALILVPLAVDRVAAARAQARTATAFQQGMGTPERPDVRIHGFPVLTQLASGTLRHVDITAHDLPAAGADRPLPVSRLDLDLDGLTKSDDDTEAQARSAEATAFLSYPDLSAALGLEVSRGAGPGRIGAKVQLPFGGAATVTTTVSAASGNRIAFGRFTVVGGALPAAGEVLLDKVFTRPIQLRNIPDGLHLRSVTTTATGLSARFSGRSVTFHADDGSRRST
ncbi:hypothetical protein GCM10022403_049940 [Streptomyces coacervatus]|uniref:DUF2993 domain-containing protein n=1 Tax=Streptomyces coacervatus TaxID=647381 RepID=A0ABP7I269_9ACTN|nr:DUF2993 domain-containing protein [Streptomyces coacervatus]MDF2266160.1 DUF2993 domain-containing protein [Streptomyces coacervatus]